MFVVHLESHQHALLFWAETSWRVGLIVYIRYTLKSYMYVNSLLAFYFVFCSSHRQSQLLCYFEFSIAGQSICQVDMPRSLQVNFVVKALSRRFGMLYCPLLCLIDFQSWIVSSSIVATTVLFILLPFKLFIHNMGTLRLSPYLLFIFIACNYYPCFVSILLIF